MKIVKYILLEILFLIAMLLCGTGTMKILDILFRLDLMTFGQLGLKWVLSRGSVYRLCQL